MLLGMTLTTFTAVHVVISLLGIGSGFVVLLGLIARKRMDAWTSFFLATTVATSVTGFMFPVDRVLPSHIVGAISLIVLAIAICARYLFRMEGRWRRTYVITSSIALYLNVFVGIVQAFQKVPLLRAAAPTQSELPFVVAQLSVLTAFVVLSAIAVKKFRELPGARAAALGGR
jgi:hypothetical protein